MARPLTNRPPLSAGDCVSISEVADLFGFPASVVLAAIERNRSAVTKPFYSIPMLAERWNCSRATVYNILRESEFKIFDMRRRGDKGKWNVPASVVERIERSRMRALPEAATETERAA